MGFRCERLLPVISVNMVQSHLWQKPIWISYESSSSWCFDMKAFTSHLSHDRCPREMGSLSCTVQRDTTTSDNHEMHQTLTPSCCLLNKRTVCSTERNNNRPTISSAIVERPAWVAVKEICISFPRRRDDETDISVGSSLPVWVVKP